MSGILNDPPISTNSPLETGISPFSANVLSTNSNAAALLFTTVAASAPINSQTNASIWSSRSPLLPSSRLYSRLVGEAATLFIASIAVCGSTARPKFV